LPFNRLVLEKKLVGFKSPIILTKREPISTSLTYRKRKSVESLQGRKDYFLGRAKSSL